MEDYYRSRLMQMFFKLVQQAETMGTVAKAEMRRADIKAGDESDSRFAHQAATLAAHHAIEAVAVREAIKYIKKRGA